MQFKTAINGPGGITVFSECVAVSAFVAAKKKKIPNLLSKITSQKNYLGNMNTV
jgi:hypothetical protein